MYNLIIRVNSKVTVPFVHVLLLLLLSGLHLLYAWRTQLYFSQDDFTVLAYFKTYPVWIMIRQFLIRGDPWGFHKLLGYLNLRLVYDLFGVQPWPYIINNHLLQTANVLLLYLITVRLTGERAKAFFLAIIFNATYLLYFSNVHEYLVTTLSLSTIYAFLTAGKRRWSVVLFVLALLTKEVAASLPLVLTAINISQRRSIRAVMPFWLLAGVYGLWQLSFASVRLTLPADQPYATTFQVSTWWRNLQLYLSPHWAVLLLCSLVLIWHRRSFWLLITFLVTLFPALMLKNRHEYYYWYLPSVYLMFYLGITIPQFNLRTWPLYVAIFFWLGGRQLLPIVARKTYPNWQLASIRQVLTQVQSSLKNNPETEEIDFATLKLERDARLLLDSNVIDLFLPATISAHYRFDYDQSQGVLKVVKAKQA